MSIDGIVNTVKDPELEKQHSEYLGKGIIKEGLLYSREISREVENKGFAHSDGNTYITIKKEGGNTFTVLNAKYRNDREVLDFIKRYYDVTIKPQSILRRYVLR